MFRVWAIYFFDIEPCAPSNIRYVRINLGWRRNELWSEDSKGIKIDNNLKRW
jgi:hypothetical protein